MTTVQTTRVQADKGQRQSRSGLMAMLVVITLISGPLSLGPADLLPSASAATSHAPIHIRDNADLTAQASAEGWPGNGTETDPYVISGHTIAATGEPGIQIDRTTLHIVIRDNDVSAGLNEFGIWLNRSHNVRIEHNQVRDASFGIFIDGGLNVHVARNTVADSFWGIVLISSTDLTVTDNEAHGNQNGIMALTVWNVDIAGNHAHNNTKRGLYWDDLRDSQVRDNLARDNAETGIHLRRSTGITLSGNLAQDNPTGILVDESLHNSVLGNTATGGGTGIHLLHSHLTQVDDNHVAAGSHGILLTRSTGNTITANQARGGTNGLHLDASHRNILDGNHAEANTIGTRIQNANDNTITNATANATGTGIYLWNSLRNDVPFAHVTNATNAVHLEAARDNTVRNGTFTDNTVGIRATNARGTDIRGNALHDNAKALLVKGGAEHTVRTNHITDNGVGIHVERTKDNLVYDNIFENDQNVERIDADDNQWNAQQTSGPNIIGGTWLGGNLWHDYTGFDLDGDGLGDIAHTAVPNVFPLVNQALRDQGIGDGPRDELPLMRELLVLGGL